MKKLFTLIIALTVYSIVLAQSPEKISYQAVIRNSTNQLVVNKVVKIKISILQGSSTGSSVYVETHNPTTNANGLASIEIGNGTVESGSLSSINWASGPFFIKTEADPNGGTNYTISGTSQILSVPYALFAKAAENITGTLNETDPVFNAWDKSTGISITENQISDLKSYITSESDPAVSSNFDFSDAVAGDLLQFNGTKWVKITPNYLTSYTESQSLSDVVAIGNNANGQIKNLSDPTDNKDAVTKDYVTLKVSKTGDTLYLGKNQFVILSGISESNDKELIFDFEGHGYKTITIGSQIWMAENLRSKKYNDGTIIPMEPENSDWAIASPHYCWYKNNEPSYNENYGILYNWFVASSNKICPVGWHVPSNTEWNTLITYLGGINVAGGSLKETGFLYWLSPNTGATNSSGFSARGAGSRNYDGTFGGLNLSGIFWSTTETPPNWGNTCTTDYSVSTAFISTAYKTGGYSIRCIKD